MSDKWQLRLNAVRDVLIDKNEAIQTIPKFGRTEYAFVITGWMPADDSNDLRKALKEKWNEDVIIEQVEIAEGEFANTPVAMKNPKAMEPFQKLLTIYGTPMYGTIDPTPMLFIFYPIFFGMIVGDFGYGLVMLGIILWLRFRHRDSDVIQLATSILGPAATMVIAFGLLYGEFFGDLLSHYLNWIQEITVFGITLPFHRIELATTFMMIALVVGIIQVGIGLTVGVINGVRTKHWNHVWEKSGLLTFLTGLILVVLALLPQAEALGETAALVIQAVGALAMFVGFAFALKGGKFMGVIEIIDIFTHSASYLRIMAVGLAGAIFADAINSIVAMMGNPIAAAAIAVILHSLAFIIAAFSPTIHALRLNFLEFFGKFYETGKKQYKPFTKTGDREGV